MSWMDGADSSWHAGRPGHYHCSGGSSNAFYQRASIRYNGWLLLSSRWIVLCQRRVPVKELLRKLHDKTYGEEIMRHV